MSTPAAAYSYTPYCGLPGAPATFWSRWNFDPLLLAVIFAFAVLYGVFGYRNRVERGWRQACVLLGFGVAAAAVVSPLCLLSVSLFSARVTQHMILTCIAAPLLAMGWKAGERIGRSALPAAAVFAAVLWAWHAPGPYTLTFRHAWAYGLMDVSLMASAISLWAALLAARGRAMAGFAAACALTSAQMGLLGALVTFAPRPLYPPHLLTTLVWGLSPLQDQAMGGAIMWIPAGLLLAAGMAVAMQDLLHSASVRAARASV